MSKEKQIEEMTELICDNYANGKCATDGFVCNRDCEYKDRAELLYNAGYRKQGDLSPCDVCRFNPPSSFDGKPCAICPAQ